MGAYRDLWARPSDKRCLELRLCPVSACSSSPAAVGIMAEVPPLRLRAQDASINGFSICGAAFCSGPDRPPCQRFEVCRNLICANQRDIVPRVVPADIRIRTDLLHAPGALLLSLPLCSIIRRQPDE